MWVPFVVPVVGGFLGFALGICLAERIRTGNQAMECPRMGAQGHRSEHGRWPAVGLAIAATWAVAVAKIT